MTAKHMPGCREWVRCCPKLACVKELTGVKHRGKSARERLAGPYRMKF